MLTVLFVGSSLLYLGFSYLFIDASLMLSTVFYGFFAGVMLSAFLNATADYFKGRILKLIYVSIVATCWFKYALSIPFVIKNNMGIGVLMVITVVASLATLFTLAWLGGGISYKQRSNNPKEIQSSEI